MKNIAISLALLFSTLPLAACLDDDASTDQTDQDPDQKAQTKEPSEQPDDVPTDVDPGTQTPPPGTKTQCCIVLKNAVQHPPVDGVRQ